MNRTRLYHTRKTLEKFVSTSLGLEHKKNCLKPSVINACLVSACAHNTYIETLCDKADSILRHIKHSETSMITFSYLDFIGQVSRKIRLNQKKVVLAFDYTKEVFWGDIGGFDIFGTKKAEKGSGEFRFLTCSQVSGKLHAKIPLISIPVRLGHNKSQAIAYCLSLIKKYVGEIELVLFDREFYAKEVMMSLNHDNIPYLIFVPKKKGVIQETLSQMYTGETLTKVHKFDLNKHKTVYRDKTSMSFLRAIFDEKSSNHFDWCFVTNLDNFDVNKMIPTYKCRWRIETGFRVQDEADSRSNSKELIIRYFMFMYEQLLQSIWHVFYKKEEEVPFKRFVITLNNMLQEDGVHEGSKVHRIVL